MAAEILAYADAGVELWKIAKIFGTTVADIEDIIAARDDDERNSATRRLARDVFGGGGL